MRLIQREHTDECEVTFNGVVMDVVHVVVHVGVVHFGLLRRYDVVRVVSGEKDEKADPLEDPIDGVSCTHWLVSPARHSAMCEGGALDAPSLCLLFAVRFWRGSSL